MWHRHDQMGRMARQILEPPLTVHSFDKSRGVSMVNERHLGPRLNLRFLATYKTLALIVASFGFGQLMFGVPSFGFLLLLAMTMFCLFVRSIFIDPM